MKGVFYENYTALHSRVRHMAKIFHTTSFAPRVTVYPKKLISKVINHLRFGSFTAEDPSMIKVSKQGFPKC